MTFKTLAAFTKFLERTTVRMALLTTQAAELGSFVLYEHIHKAYGDTNKLAPLATWTREERAALGFSEDEPLLRDGTLLRNHEHREVIGDLAIVGNDEVISAYHEMGYINALTGTAVPARPVHKIGLDESQAEIEALYIDCARFAMGESVRIRVNRNVA